MNRSDLNRERDGREMQRRKEVDGMALWKGLKEYARDDAGMGTVEVILIIVVLVGLVLIFKKQITQIVNDLFDSIVTKSADVAR